MRSPVSSWLRIRQLTAVAQLLRPESMGALRRLPHVHRRSGRLLRHRLLPGSPVAGAQAEEVCGASVMSRLRCASVELTFCPLPLVALLHPWKRTSRLASLLQLVTTAKLTEYSTERLQVLFMAGFAILQGPLAHLKHIFSSERLPFTAAYFGSLILTLIFALVVSRPRPSACASLAEQRQPIEGPSCASQKQSYLGTLVCAIVQCFALVAYFVSCTSSRHLPSAPRLM